MFSEHLHSPHLGFTTDRTLTPLELKTWVSLRYPKDPQGEGRKQWYVLRATYNRAFKACEYLEEHGIPTYIPMHKEETWKPFFANMFFAYATREEMERLTKDSAASSYLSYLYDHNVTDPAGKNPPMTVSYGEMENFIMLTGMADPYTILVQPDKCRILSDTMVEVTKGPYEGIRGRKGRCFRQQRVIVRSAGYLFATGYVPTGIMKEIES